MRKLKTDTRTDGQTRGLKYTNNNIKLLVELVGDNLSKLQTENIENMVQEMSLHFWKGKYQSYKGTIRVIKTYILLQMLYDTETQPPSTKQIDKVEFEIKSSLKKQP